MSKETVIQARQLPIEMLRPFEQHPFQVKDDEEMDQLVWSVLTQGVLTPLVVRPLEKDVYQVISGHRRLHACQKAGITEVPALVYPLDRDAAAIALVDSNLHRERLLPSEKAFAYKLKMEAMSRQGQRTDLTSDQVGPKLTAAAIAESESVSQVKRYIRLTQLIPPILQMVDEGRIALTPAVELSYLATEQQEALLEAMECEDCTPSLAQAVQMKKESQEGTLTVEVLFQLLRQPKANQQDKISFPISELRSYFPKSYTAAQMRMDILRGLELLQRKRSQHRDGR